MCSAGPGVSFVLLWLLWGLTGCLGGWDEAVCSDAQSCQQSLSPGPGLYLSLTQLLNGNEFPLVCFGVYFFKFKNSAGQNHNC